MSRSIKYNSNKAALIAYYDCGICDESHSPWRPLCQQILVNQSLQVGPVHPDDLCHQVVRYRQIYPLKKTNKLQV